MTRRRWHTIAITGIVQGVGFRPTVYRLASRMGLAGNVSNGVDGVTVNILSTHAEALGLASAIRAEAPPLARIDTIIVCEGGRGEADRFEIVSNAQAMAAEVTDVSPDAAICPACLADMERRGDRRHDYPLTNCTLCGPRFSITRALPYDRATTVMDRFGMCRACAAEYADPADRRFHAQPVSCNDCGPRYHMGEITGQREVVDATAHLLLDGHVVMAKSIGGYNLLADATNTGALRRLRELKNRPRKPFVVMVADIGAARRMADISDTEASVLQSWRAPVMIAGLKAPVSPLLAPSLSTIGVMLPYTGFHHMLMKALGGRPIAVTSANRPGSPMITDDTDAESYCAESGLPRPAAHNRPIHNRVDDSVARVIDGRPRLLRRARGYVPDVLRTGAGIPAGIMAMGADITSQWALTRGRDIILSQYIGPLLTSGGEQFLRKSIRHMSALYRFKPQTVVIDAHPGYASSRIGREIAASCGAQLLAVWHHHAHALSVMAEHGITGRVLAIVLDGTGAGPDGTVWGGELLECTPAGFERVAHGLPLMMPGGDKAARQPWRMAVSLYHSLGLDLRALPRHITDSVGEQKIRVVAQMLDKRVNCPVSTGAGRLWDAMAAITGVALENSYEAEGPILLEGLASQSPHTECRYNSLKELLVSGLPPAETSACFHYMQARWWAEKTAEAARQRHLDTVVLAGGVMQNKLFTELLCRLLRQRGLTPLLGEAVPPGDGGIAVGQAWHATTLPLS